MLDLNKCRTRNWVFIMYPDSMPDNDFDKCVLILEDFHSPFAISPLHDKDFNATGEKKKPHYHVLFTFDGVKSYKQMQEICQSVNGSDCRPCENARGYYRYFCHLDNPEKAPYNESDIKTYCGFDSEIYNKPTSMARYLAIKEMVNFIKDSNIIEYCDFVDICANVHFEWFKLLSDNSSFIINEYIKSFRNKHKEDNDVKHTKNNKKKSGI